MSFISDGFRLLVISCVLLFSSSIVHSETKVIVNPSVGSIELDQIYLNQIFAMQVRKWPNGETIKVFSLPSDNPVHRDFTLNQLRVHSHQLDRIWSRMLFTGTGRTPTIVKSEEKMIEAINNTPGAIGYVSKGTEEVSESNREVSDEE